MIEYDRSPFGVNLLIRCNGSAAYRAAIPGLVSVIFLMIMRLFWNAGKVIPSELRHPYVVAVLVNGIFFLMVFRLQQGYNRYWEAATDVYKMVSSWTDAAVQSAACHMQSQQFDTIKPTSFHTNHDLNLNYLTRDREFVYYDHSYDEVERLRTRATAKSIESVVERHSVLKNLNSNRCLHTKQQTGDSLDHPLTVNCFGHPVPIPLEGDPALDGNWGKLVPDGKSTFLNPNDVKARDSLGFASYQGGRTPALFLQELAHLTSLLSSVALSTLRNVVEGAQSPLDAYLPGSPWPPVDPKIGNLRSKIALFVGFGRTPRACLHYNTSCPIPVLGGVSDAEIRFLQIARGPHAKVQLCMYWLSEFLVREHLAGSMGQISSPIVSRVLQLIGDGMTSYHQAHKIVQIPFPFPHAQLAMIYSLIAIPVVAFVMEQYVEDSWAASMMSFLTVTVLIGMHEVARELENPFRYPNDLPLSRLQAQMNESLITMYSGYHPDHFWAISTANQSLKPPQDTSDDRHSQAAHCTTDTNGSPPVVS